MEISFKISELKKFLLDCCFTESVFHSGLCSWHDYCVWLFLNNFMWRFKKRISSIRYTQQWLTKFSQKNKETKHNNNNNKHTTKYQSFLPFHIEGKKPIKLTFIYKGKTIWSYQFIQHTHTHKKKPHNLVILPLDPYPLKINFLQIICLVHLCST